MGKILGGAFAGFMGLILIIGLVFTLWLNMTPGGRTFYHNWQHSLKSSDEQAYEVRKEVEDEARTMIAYYKSSALLYEQYYAYCEIEEEDKTEFDRIKCTDSEAYKQRANTTAIKYNEYILNNSYKWEGNIPSDISWELAIIT